MKVWLRRRWDRGDIGGALMAVGAVLAVAGLIMTLECARGACSVMTPSHSVICSIESADGLRR